MSQSSPFKKNDDATEEEAKKPSGMTRKSASRAKPAREAAQGVRVVSSKPSKKKSTSRAPMTKEERKALRRAERAEEDQVANITDILMKKNPEYRRYRRVWWLLLTLGFGFVIVSFIVGSIGQRQGDAVYNFTTPLGITAIVTLILAYATIIGSIVWEFTKIRPIRRADMSRVQSMSQKRRQAVLEGSYEEEERKRAKKKAGKK